MARHVVLVVVLVRAVVVLLVKLVVGHIVDAIVLERLAREVVDGPGDDLSGRTKGAETSWVSKVRPKEWRGES